MTERAAYSGPWLPEPIATERVTGGRVPAARKVVRGSDRIARFMPGLERKYRHVITHEIRSLNGEPAIVTSALGRVVFVTALETDGERIVAAYRVLNPEKLRFVA